MEFNFFLLEYHVGLVRIEYRWLVGFGKVVLSVADNHASLADCTVANYDQSHYFLRAHRVAKSFSHFVFKINNISMT